MHCNMSITTAIQNARTKIAAAYTSCNNKDATMPAAGSQNLTNLAPTIDTIVTDIPFNQTIQTVNRNEEDGVVTYTRGEEYVGIMTVLPSRKYENDTTLVKALLPDTVNVISSHAFQGCTNLKYTNLENVEQIHEWAFEGCTSLEYIDLSNAIRVDQLAFYNCTNLKIDLVWPDSIPIITRAVFRHSGVRSAKLNISAFGGDFTFSNCTNLISVDLSESTITTTYCASTTEGGTFSGCSSLKTVLLPLTCTELGNFSFFYCTSLETVTGTENVTVIRNNAFRECNSLGNFDMSSVETIETFSLTHTNLTTVNLPSIVTIQGSIYGGAPFFGCSELEYVDIGPNCEYIGEFAFQNCYNLDTVIVRATVPPETGQRMFFDTNTTFKFYVPYSADHSIISAYQNATNWTTYASQMYELNPDGTIPV